MPVKLHKNEGPQTWLGAQADYDTVSFESILRSGTLHICDIQKRNAIHFLEKNVFGC